MRTFAQKQDRLQKSASSGTHVVELLRAHAKGSNEGLAGTAALRLGHDFSRIPIYPPPARAIQAELAINQPGDAFEQEADRVADQVLAAPAHAGVMRAPARIRRLAGQSAGPMDAITSCRPSSWTRYTLPSNRLDTCKRPSGAKAIEVAFTIPVTNGSRGPPGVTRNTETGACWPRVPL